MGRACWLPLAHEFLVVGAQGSAPPPRSLKGPQHPRGHQWASSERVLVRTDPSASEHPATSMVHPHNETMKRPRLCRVGPPPGLPATRPRSERCGSAPGRPWERAGLALEMPTGAGDAGRGGGPPRTEGHSRRGSPPFGRLAPGLGPRWWPPGRAPVAAEAGEHRGPPAPGLQPQAWGSGLQGPLCEPRVSLPPCPRLACRRARQAQGTLRAPVLNLPSTCTGPGSRGLCDVTGERRCWTGGGRRRARGQTQAHSVPFLWRSHR